MSNKERIFLRLLCGLNPNWFLTALSSQYAEEDSEQFEADYGVTIKEANEIVTKFLAKLK